MIGEYRLVLVLLLILFVPLFYKYVCRWPRQQKQQPKDLLQQMETVQKKENEQSDSTEPVILSGKAERPQQSEMLVAPSLVYVEKRHSCCSRKRLLWTYNLSPSPCSFPSYPIIRLFLFRIR